MKMNMTHALSAIKETLQNKVADYLDVNRHHIQITLLDTELIGEDIIDWDADEYDAAEGREFETYYRFGYQYREDTKHLDWGEDTFMIWLHTEGDNTIEGGFDTVMTEEEFDKRFEDKKSDVKSMLWYEGDR